MNKTEENMRQGAGSGRAVQRTYKSTVFHMLYHDRKYLLELYNAVGGKDYADEGMLEIVTLENAIYLGVKNDLAFLIDCWLSLYEHQSTVNPNMPFRFLQYVTEEYGRLTAGENFYGRRLVTLPTPRFVVFYNGVDEQPERQVLKLSAAYQVAEEEPQLELQVLALNINEGYNEELKERCRSLKEYMQYVERVRGYASFMSMEEAVDRAVDECIAEGILREFLLANKAEVKRMSIFEYDEEAMKRAIREDGYELGIAAGRAEGIAAGRAESILQILAELGDAPEEMRERILAERDIDTLDRWFRAALKAESVEEFGRKITEAG